LADVGWVVLYLESPVLGRPGDNQYEYLNAAFKDGMGIFHFSDGLRIEISRPIKLDVSGAYIELHSIEILGVSWRGSFVELHDTLLRIDK
jgi:hypothetical protein